MFKKARPARPQAIWRAERTGVYVSTQRGEYAAGELFQHPAKDNFILVDSQGQTRRTDAGDSEGHRMPFVVQEIVEDGDTPWYVEFWHWITG